MSLLSYNELVKLVESGVIDAPIENVNSSSIDLTLDDVIMLEFEDSCGDQIKPVDLIEKKNIDLVKWDMGKGNNYDNNDEQYNDPFCYWLRAGEFVLASSRETFNLPNNISAEYKLKSSMARNGLEHLNAGWCDAGWHGSKLTLELKNMTQNHTLILRPGMKIGQVVFFKHEPVPEDKSYAARGQYNGQQQVTASKGIR